MSSSPATDLHANDLTFETTDSGIGPIALLLHGFPESRFMWDDVIERLNTAGLRAVAPNLRGYSSGAQPRDVDAYGIENLEADVVAMIEALDSGPVHLVGHDWGGIVGWFVAAHHPELVASYTAISTSHPQAVMQASLADETQRDQLEYIKALRDPAAEEFLRADDFAALFGALVDLPRDKFEPHARVLAEPGALTGALNYYRAYDPQDGLGLGKVSVPTTYIWGSHDMAFGRTAALDTESYVDAPYEFIEMDGVGHWIPELHPDVVADAIARRVLEPTE